jgi:hypothetical protein
MLMLLARADAPEEDAVAIWVSEPSRDRSRAWPGKESGRGGNVEFAAGPAFARFRCDLERWRGGMRRQARLWNPLLEVPPTGVQSCEHCRTVTWAGRAACDCEFARLAVDESAVARLRDGGTATVTARPDGRGACGRDDVDGGS